MLHRLVRHPHDREILRLAVPALGSLVAEPLFLLADSAIVGHLGTAQLAGLGAAGAVVATAVSVCVFLAYGTTAAVARRIGAGDQPGAIAVGIDGMWLATVIGVLLVAVAVPMSGALVGWLGTSAAATPYATTYLRIAVLGIPPLLLVTASTGVLRGLQDTRTPLVVAVVANVANVALNLVLVYPVGLGIAGSALGTVLAQLGAALAYVLVVTRGARRTGASLRPDRRGILLAAAAGLPLLVRTLTLRAALLVLASVAARQGTVALAAHQIAFAVWTFLALALDAVAIAAQAIVGRALGAGDVSAARAATARMVQWGLGVGAALAVAVLVTRAAYVPLFTSDHDVRELLTRVLVVVAVMQPVCGIVFVLDGVLMGAGDGRYLAIAGVLTLAAYLPGALAVQHAQAGLVALWWAFVLFLLARLVTLVARERGDAWLVTGATR